MRVSVSENLVSKKKVLVLVLKKFGLGFGQNFGIIIQCLCVSASHRFCVCG